MCITIRQVTVQVSDSLVNFLYRNVHLTMPKDLKGFLGTEINNLADISPKRLKYNICIVRIKLSNNI